VWTAEDYVCWWLSPEGALAIWWVGFFGVALVVLTTRRIRWAAGLALAVFVAIAGQSLAFTLALMAGASAREHGGNPSDAFTAGALAGGFAWLPAVVVVGMAWKAGRLPEDGAPVRFARQSSGTPLWLLLISGAIGIVFVGAIGVVVVVGGVLFWILAALFAPPLWEWKSVPLEAVFSVLSASALVSAWLLLSRARLSFRKYLLLCLPAFWGLALIGAAYPISTARLGAMSDEALVHRFVSRLNDDRIARGVLAELHSRSADPGRTEAFMRRFSRGSLPRGSGFARALRALRGIDDPRETPSARVAKLESDKYRRTGDVIGWGWDHYRGRPERDLLAISIARGELEEPRAWARDPKVSEGVRKQIQMLLDEHARKLRTR
jgi:hypothetical protein